MKVVLRPPHLPRDYRIVTVVELKRDDDEISKAVSQMHAYMKRINEISSPDNSFKGFLVLEDEVEIFSYVGHGANRRPLSLGTYSMFDAGNPWTRDLADIAIRYWN